MTAPLAERVRRGALRAHPRTSSRWRGCRSGRTSCARSSGCRRDRPTPLRASADAGGATPRSSARSRSACSRSRWLVTLPFALLLLDVWPLRRVALGRWRAARDPAAVTWRVRSPRSCRSSRSRPRSRVVTSLAQRSAGALATLGALPLACRVENAVVVVRALPAASSSGRRASPSSTRWRCRCRSAWSPRRRSAARDQRAAVVRDAPPRPCLLVGWLWYLGHAACR